MSSELRGLTSNRSIVWFMVATFVCPMVLMAAVVPPIGVAVLLEGLRENPSDRGYLYGAIAVAFLGVFVLLGLAALIRLRKARRSEPTRLPAPVHVFPFDQPGRHVCTRQANIAIDGKPI